MPHKIGEVTTSNGKQEKVSKFSEIGTTGLDALSGVINEAYIKELQWPGVWPIYQRMHRADPEVAIARFMYSALASEVDIIPKLPENPSADDIKFAEFAGEVLDDLDGGIGRFRDKVISNVPFMGFGWWEIVAGLRNEKWRPPDKLDPWRSQFNDGLIGIRRIAWRDYSSFFRWIMNDESAKLLGLEQFTQTGGNVEIPLDKSIHITSGDNDNPEGWPILEPLYRLERYKFGLEVVQGIGFEHSAGYLSIQSETALGANDLEIVKRMARAILTAQEGNYAAWPKGVTAEIIDSTFSAATSILDAIRYYGLLKLQLFNMQWVAMAATADTGSFAALQDSSLMSTMTFNAIMENFVGQFSRQFVSYLLKANPNQWPGLTGHPEFVATKVQKSFNLAELGAFMTAYAKNWPLSEGDLIQFRKEAGFMLEELPTPENVVDIRTEEVKGGDDKDSEDGEGDSDDKEKKDKKDEDDEDKEDSDLTLGVTVVSRAVEETMKQLKLEDPGAHALMMEDEK